MRLGASIFLRADGRWQARYQKGKDEKGKTVYGCVYGKTQEEAESKRRKALLALGKDHIDESSPLPSRNPQIAYTPPYQRQGQPTRRKEKTEEPLDDERAARADRLLEGSREIGAELFYLWLHCGISLLEGSALTWGDLDPAARCVHVRRTAERREGQIVIGPVERPRQAAISAETAAYLAGRSEKKDPEAYLVTGTRQPPVHLKTVSAALRRIVKEDPLLKEITAGQLRSTFLRRCLESGLNIETVCALTGEERGILYRYFGQYIHVAGDAIERVEEREGCVRPTGGGRELNLLILGAGSLGRAVKELAERMGIFQRIAFLDDTAKGPEILGSCREAGRYAARFPCAFVAIGDNVARQYYAGLLRREGFLLPRMISPDAAVSADATIGEGCVILPQATVNAAAVGDFCIIASNALVSFGAAVGSFSHLECGSIVLKESEVPAMTAIESGEIYPRTPEGRSPASRTSSASRRPAQEKKG